jgi:hypothetical protein
MDFITIPIVVWICVAGTYSLIELFVRRKERLILIERYGDKIDPDILKGNISLFRFKQPSFSALKIGCLLVGAGLGLMLGVVLNIYDLMHNYHLREMSYGAPLLLFGGLGLIISFLIERKITARASQEESSKH